MLLFLYNIKKEWHIWDLESVSAKRSAVFMSAQARRLAEGANKKNTGDVGS